MSENRNTARPHSPRHQNSALEARESNGEQIDGKTTKDELSSAKGNSSQQLHQGNGNSASGAALFQNGLSLSSIDCMFSVFDAKQEQRGTAASPAVPDHSHRSDQDDIQESREHGGDRSNPPGRPIKLIPVPGDPRKKMLPLNLYSKAITCYREMTLVPLAKMVGLTPECVLRMIVTMRGAATVRTLILRRIPFYGYSPQHAYPHSEQIRESVPSEWSMRELLCLSALYTDAHYRCSRSERLQYVKERHMYQRSQEDIEGGLHVLHANPWLVKADSERVVSLYRHQREEAARTVARRLHIDESLWPSVEWVLFDPFHGYVRNCAAGKSFWAPRHAKTSREMNELLSLVFSCRMSKRPSNTERSWTQIDKMLFSREGPNLFPVVLRCAAGPPPSQSARSTSYGTPSHSDYRARMLAWINESLDAI